MSNARLWRDRRFAGYWGAQAVSELGDRVSELAIPLIAVTMLGAGAGTVGMLTAAVWAPNLLSLIVGSWVDTRPRKQPLLVGADLVQGLAVLSLPVLHFLGTITLAQLFAVALVAGAGRVVGQAANPTFFVALVPRERYLEANAMLSTTRAASFIAGPAAAGALIQLLTAPVAMAVDAASFLVSALLVRRIRVDETPRASAPTGDPLLTRARDGLRFVFRHPYLRASLLCCTTLNFCSFVVSALVILYAARTLGLGAGAIGLAFGLGATGGLVGAVLASRLSRLLGMGRAIAIGAVLFCAPFALIPAAGGAEWTKIAVLALVEFVSSTGIMVFDVNLNALQTAVTPDDKRSRSVGAFATVNYGIRPIGAVVGGACGSAIGVGPTMICAAVGGALSFLWLLGSPIIGTRTIEQLEPSAA